MCEDYRASASIDLEHDAADGHERLGLARWPVRVPSVEERP